jgi:putative membrane protein
MVRSLIKVALAIAGNALGLLIADVLLDRMSLSASGFIVAVLVFTVIEVIAQPLVTKLARSRAEALEGGSALVSTLVALVFTALITDGLDISGIGTWLLATIIVWIVTLLAGVILPIFFLKDADSDKR